MAKSQEHKTFCENIKQRRLELKLTQAEAAARLSVTPSTYSDYENGRSDPTLTLAGRICRALEMPLSDAIQEHSVAN